jgi:hypothetical protein
MILFELFHFQLILQFFILNFEQFKYLVVRSIWIIIILSLKPMEYKYIKVISNIFIICKLMNEH